MNILLCLIGALVGTLIGVLPGIGPLATIAMLLPITFGLPPVGALIMLAGIYYGAQYGGSTTSILVNIPGESSVGGDDARRPPDGEAGPRRSGARDRGDRLVLRRLASRPCWSRRSARRSTALALMFGPAEYFSLMVLGLVFAVVLAKGSVLKAIAMILFGLLLSMRRLRHRDRRSRA